MLLIPRRQIRTQQPQGAVRLAAEYFKDSALCLLPSRLDLVNRAQTNHGKRLTRVSPLLKASQTGLGVACANTTRSFLDTDWVNPIQSSASDGTGAFSLLFSATLASAAARSVPFHIRLNSGAFNTVFIVQNGGRDEGADTSYNEAGTLWMGTFEGATNHARGLKVTGAFGAAATPITALFNRNADGTTGLWLNGVRVATNAVGYPTALTTGAAQYLSLGGFASADGFASPDPVNLVYAANRSFTDAQSAQLSRNPWQIFDAPADSRIWVPVSAGAGAGADLSGTAQAVASASGNLTLTASLDGAALAVASASGTLSTQIAIAGAAVSVASSSGALLAQIRLDGAAIAEAAAAAGLESQILLAGSAQAQASASGTLAADASSLAGNAQAQSAAIATLTTSIRLSGDAAAQAGVSGLLTTTIQLSAAALAQAIATGVLGVPILLAGNALAQASASGTLDGATVIPVVDRRYVAVSAPRAWIAVATRREFTAVATPRQWEARL